MCQTINEELSGPRQILQLMDLLLFHLGLLLTLTNFGFLQKNMLQVFLKSLKKKLMIYL